MKRLISKHHYVRWTNNKIQSWLCLLPSKVITIFLSLPGVATNAPGTKQLGQKEGIKHGTATSENAN